MNAKKVLAFYEMLYDFVTTPRFNTRKAESLVATFKKRPGFLTISLEECTMKSLKAVHEEYHDGNSSLGMVKSISEAAFSDLAPQLRNPHARYICADFQSISGTRTATDLYVKVQNYRLLDEDEKGNAVVVLVVNSYSVLIDLLQKCQESSCKNTHFSYGVHTLSFSYETPKQSVSVTSP